jgi:protein involved in polysaccharide export with SLBB domain
MRTICEARRAVRFFACAIAAFLLIAASVHAQDHRAPTVQGSELGRENLNRVAASAGEIKTVLLQDAGLMVELKRWVAKDATDHGQIVSDSDLTDDAIFERLETDIQFRAIATRLVQRFGYLIPKVNPESELAKEHELLIQERTKWLAQNQEEELAQARQRSTRNIENTSSCDPQIDADCNAVRSRPPSARGEEDESLPGASHPGTAPSEPDQQNTPGGTGNRIDRTQLMQTGGEFADDFSSLGFGSLLDPTQPQENLDVNPFGALTPQMPQNITGGRFGAYLPTSSSDGRSAIEAAAMNNNVAPSERSNTQPFDSSLKNGREGNGLATMGGSSFVPVQPNARPQPAEMVRKPNPYNDIPSLYDMYVQTVARPAAPKRFGAEVFEHGTRDSQSVPMDLPVGPEYVVGPGDGLAINLWGGVSQRLYRTVDREGRVSLPEVGPVLVSGKSLADVQQNLQQILRTQFRDISADVSLARLRTIRVYEVGDVANPGAYDISSLSTPLNALFVAGGPTPRGSMRILKHYRGKELVEEVDAYDLLLHGVRADVQRLENGDTVLVPPIGPQVTVEGMVRRPAIYELKDEKNLASALELAGGLLPTAALRHIEVQRIVAHDKQTMLSLDIPESDASAEVTKKLEAFEIQDGDRIRVFPIAPYNQDAIYLEGHVIRPGRYSYQAGMRVTDVIASFKDLLPEPATRYAEIIRLNAPDFHPSVESFDLADAMANPSQAPALQPMDTVRIFSRFDFENPPMVSVGGGVRVPGNYQTSGDIRLSDAVHLAGGLTPEADTEDAQIFRYLPDGKVKVFSVNLSQALEGAPSENILLQPRDRLLIHQNPDAAERATVYLQGEAGKPGRYPLTTNMTVADLIRVGGGLKPSADTQTADLMHFEWSNQSKLTGQHQAIAISAALARDPAADTPLHNGDVVTIRQLPGWNDLGASISVKGEVKNPGTYGIHPGERLSSVLERAGGFQPEAYPYGAVLTRTQVRELESQAQSEMIVRVKEAQTNFALLPETDARQKQAKELAIQQWQSSLDQLTANPPVGRVAMHISGDINRWKNTDADMDVRAGDTLTIPKKPGFVMVTGQVFNPTAVSYRPGKSAKWYLSQSGGPTQMANKKAIFVIRADGSVAGVKGSMWSGGTLDAQLRPGDTVVVPEKAIVGGIQWQTVFLATQVASSVASTAFIALRY